MTGTDKKEKDDGSKPKTNYRPEDFTITVNGIPIEPSDSFGFIRSEFVREELGVDLPADAPEILRIDVEGEDD